MQDVVFRVRATDGHGPWEARVKEVLDLLPSVGDRVLISVHTSEVHGDERISRRRIGNRAGVIVERIELDGTLDNEDIMSPFVGAIIDCRWA